MEINELRGIQSGISIRMCRAFIQRYPDIVAQGIKQQWEATCYARHRPEDSRFDPDRILREQFNLLRVVDNERYPAFFELDGEHYILKIEKKI